MVPASIGVGVAGLPTTTFIVSTTRPSSYIDSRAVAALTMI